MTTIDLARSRANYARLRVPDWLPDPLIVPMSVYGHAMVENAAAALVAYRFAHRAVRLVLANGSEHIGWVADLHVVRDPNPDGEASHGAVLIETEGDEAFVIDLASIRQIEDCKALADRI